MISAFAKIAPLVPETDLVLAGPDQSGWVDQLKRQATAAGIADRIHWPGMLEGDAKWGAFRGCDAFVLPSHQENFGIVVAEAMASAKPVLITDKVNIWREIEKGNAGFVVPYNEFGIVSLLETFFALSREERNRMGNSARGTFLELFEINKNAVRLLEIFDESLPDRPSV